MIDWKIKHYDDLDINEFHDLLALRVEIFVVEQNCPYQEIDGKDKVSYHLIGQDEQQNTVATARILPAKVYFEEVTIGRIVVSKLQRRKGIGDQIMIQSMKFVEEKFGKQNIKLAAQAEMAHFYEKHGFEKVSKPYDWDDILHVDMLFRI